VRRDDNQTSYKSHTPLNPLNDDTQAYSDHQNQSFGNFLDSNKIHLKRMSQVEPKRLASQGFGSKGQQDSQDITIGQEDIHIDRNYNYYKEA